MYAIYFKATFIFKLNQQYKYKPAVDVAKKYLKMPIKTAVLVKRFEVGTGEESNQTCNSK